MIRFLLLSLFLLVFSNHSEAQTCIAASDFGQGGYVYVPAKPDEGAGARLLDTKTSDQVANWIATDMYTAGVGGVDAQGNRLRRNILKMYIDGRWYPFGNGTDASIATSANGAGNGTQDCSVETNVPKCELLECEAPKDSRANDSVCLRGRGKTLDLGGKRRTKVPCCMDGGWGLYGMVALDRNIGRLPDPNEPSGKIARTPPNYDFRTFGVAPLRSDKEGKFFEVTMTQQCTQDSSAATVCLGDSNSSAGIVAKGRLYFQVKDRHYQDNDGFYTINIVSGVYGLAGFIETTVDAFKQQVLATSTGMFELITKDWKVISIVRAMLLLYVTLFGLMFSMGMIKATQAELVIRLFKFAIVAILISDEAFEFFNMYLFSLINEGSESIAQIIYDSTLFYSDEQKDAKFILPEDASPLSIYDILVKMLISRSLHIKIWALVFVKYYVIMIPFIYVALFFILTGIIRAVVIYVTAIVLMGILLVIAPIFIAMILFQMTRELFDGWLKMFISTGMMMIVIAAVLAITVSLFTNQTENLLTYGVCWTKIIPIIADSPGFLHWGDLYFWYPSDMKQAQDHLTAKNFFAFLFIGVLFDNIMKNVPSLIDTLASSNLRPFSRFVSGAQNTFDELQGKGLGLARAIPAYALKDNAAAQFVARKTGLADTYKDGKLVRKGLGTKIQDKLEESKLYKAGRVATTLGGGLAGGIINAESRIESSMMSQENTQAPGVIGSTMHAAQQTVHSGKTSYTEATTTKWYDPGITTETKKLPKKIGWTSDTRNR